jgi:hypothetical protein
MVIFPFVLIFNLKVRIGSLVLECFYYIFSIFLFFFLSIFFKCNFTFNTN